MKEEKLERGRQIGREGTGMTKKLFAIFKVLCVMICVPVRNGMAAFSEAEFGGHC